MKLIAYLCGNHSKKFKEKMSTGPEDLPRYCGEYDCMSKPTFEVVIEIA